MSAVVRVLGALAVGLVLAALPFALYRTGSGHSHGAGAHADHRPYHGGQLAMDGDDHLELVEKDDGFKLYVSDAHRRALRAVSAGVSVDGGPEVAFEWKSYRWTAPRPRAWSTALCRVVLADGRKLAVEFTAPGVGSR